MGGTGSRRHENGDAELEALRARVKFLESAIEGTEAKRLEAVLAENLEKLRIIAEYTLDSEYWIGPDGRLLYQSPSIEGISGHKAEEFMADPGLFESLVHPDDRAAFKADASRRQGPEPARLFTFRILRKDGAVRWIENVSRPVFDRDGRKMGIRGSDRDITERMEAELSLKKSEASLKLILDNSRDAISLTRDRKYLYGNKAFLALFGFSSLEEVVGLPGIDTIAPGSRREVQERFKSLREGWGAPIFIETRGLRTDGSEFDLEVTASSYSEEGSPTIVSILRDITERKRAEKEIRGLLGAKEILIREVHHRIKNNMATLCSILSLEAAQVRAPEAKEALLKAGSRIESMMVLYDRLYRSTDSGTVRADEYIPELVAQIVGSLRGQAAVRVESQADPAVVDTRSMATLSIALNELVTNAMKYAFMPRGGGRLSVTFRSRGGRLLLAVEDDGPGMPAPAMPDAASAKAAGGLPPSSGFGFMLVSALAGQLGGEFRAESPCPRGEAEAGEAPPAGPGTRMVIDIPFNP